MSGEHTHCPHCGDDLCQVDCRDALLDRIANYGIDLIAKDRHIAEVASENGRLGLQVEIDKERIAELEAQACEMKIYMGTLEKENERLTNRVNTLKVQLFQYTEPARDAIKKIKEQPHE